MSREQVTIEGSFEEQGRRLTLRRRGEHYDLLIDNVTLLSSAALATEVAFGKLAIHSKAKAPRVLIGGLGFGGTVRGALSVLGKSARIDVVERLHTVVHLLSNDLRHLAEGCLDDPRVHVHEQDIYALLEEAVRYDAILLDVDNGPSWASFRDNARIYSPEGIGRAYAALKPGGFYAVWAGAKHDAFLPILRKAGFEPSCVPLKEGRVVQAWAYVGIRQAAR